MRFRTFVTAILLITCTVNAAKKPTPTAANSPDSASSVSSASQPSTTVTINGKTLVYPPLDMTPNTNDPVLQEYIKGLDLSQVPNLPRSNGGVINHAQPTCNSSTQLDQNQGSWTCQKYTASDDIQQCPTVGNWGVTYDDGPSTSTPQLLDTLDECKLKATLFVVGSRVVSNPNILADAYKRDHHIAVHTWSHPALTSLSNEEVIAELFWTIKAIKDVCGITPIYYRPPYGDTDNRVRAITRAMGLITVLWNPAFDSNDWKLVATPPEKDQVVIDTFNNWTQIFPTMSTGFIVLQHDLYPETVAAAIKVLKLAINVKGLNMTTVPQCIGDTKPYLEVGGSPKFITSNNSTQTSTSTAPASPASPASSASSAKQSSKAAADSTTTNAVKSSANSLVITIFPVISILLTSLFALK